ncbi:hypothetical protein GCM10009678_69090 [Actinomadura kijaniata]|uniref:Flagellar motor switch protein FliM n=1 Tax=Actinomadura namibiensis TaxID=182080 RepID=A0A7W3LQC6_ACTNM|nr:hypothetical protein [Actinomadura namibiensis]MBA8952353.1 flagellar motor switch protein FliM [Actinomadura namibiensis]
MNPRVVLLAILQDLFPTWEIWICDRGVWRAAGVMLVSASTIDGLVEHLAGADPDGFTQAARRFTRGTSSPGQNGG